MYHGKMHKMHSHCVILFLSRILFIWCSDSVVSACIRYEKAGGSLPSSDIFLYAWSLNLPNLRSGRIVASLSYSLMLVAR